MSGLPLITRTLNTSSFESRTLKTSTYSISKDSDPDPPISPSLRMDSPDTTEI